MTYERVVQSVEQFETDHLTLRPTYVARDDPANSALLKYRNLIRKEQTPTASEQRQIVQAVRANDDEAIEKLLEMNAGLISAVGYPYRSALVSNERLDELAQEAMLEASVTFDLKRPGSFTNHAVITIDQFLAKEFPGGQYRRFLTGEREPIIDVYRFMASLVPVEKGDPRLGPPLLSEAEKKELILSDAQFLQYINLPNDDFKARTGLDISTLYKRMNRLCEQLGLSSRQELALAALDAGVPIETPPLPTHLQLTDRQRLIASMAYMPYDQVADRLGTTFAAVNHATKVVKGKLRARSRTELVIMMQKYDLGPIEYDGPEYLRDFTELERSVVPYLHLESNDAISELTGLSVHGVSHAINRMMERTGTDRRRQLAVWLQERGYEFDIVKPPRPLNEVVKADRLRIWQNGHLTDEDLANQTGMDIDQLRYLLARGKALTGARSRTELALVARKHGRGEKGYKTKAQKLAEKLGWTSLDKIKLDEMLEKINPKQRKLIEGYYLADDSVTWQTVAETHDMERTLSIVTARAGILRMRRMAESASRAS